MGYSPNKLPAHLQRFVVSQDYSQYSEVSHAVWRFVLLNTQAHLRHTAHPSYARGLVETGISIERIPRIEEMNERLNHFGWGAVCVDGFIPPRAFQELQSLGILAIAADIRAAGHLAYTPAPDIIHEAAGHAPILIEPAYAAYLKAIGQASTKAFTLPQDRQVYRAIYTLSEVKENPSATPAQITAAEQALRRAEAAATRLSEASRMARLYWWTAEYGLIGRPRAFKLYGAGLLSSLGESHSCQNPSVAKLALSAECTERAYDITRAQPQLYVARDFEHLNEVLEDVAKGLVFRQGGVRALEVAEASQEVCTTRLSGPFDFAAIGMVQGFEAQNGTVVLIRFSDVPHLAQAGSMVTTLSADSISPGPKALALGPLSNGRFLAQSSKAELERDQVDKGRLELRYASGAVIRGQVLEIREAEGQILGLRLKAAKVAFADEETDLGQAPIWWPAVTGFETAHAGSCDPGYYSLVGDPDGEGYARDPDTDAQARVPRSRTLPSEEALISDLYARAMQTWRSLDSGEVVAKFQEIHDTLIKQFPGEWLLRWNLLESLLKLGQTEGLSSELEAELLALEVKFNRAEPIATGLKYLRERYYPHDSQDENAKEKAS